MCGGKRRMLEMWWRILACFIPNVTRGYLLSSHFCENTLDWPPHNQTSMLMTNWKRQPFLAAQHYARLSKSPLHPWLDSDYVGQHPLTVSICSGSVAAHCRGKSLTRKHIHTNTHNQPLQAKHSQDRCKKRSWTSSTEQPTLLCSIIDDEEAVTSHSSAHFTWVQHLTTKMLSWPKWAVSTQEAPNIETTTNPLRGKSKIRIHISQKIMSWLKRHNTLKPMFQSISKWEVGLHRYDSQSHTQTSAFTIAPIRWQVHKCKKHLAWERATVHCP